MCVTQYLEAALVAHQSSFLFYSKIEKTLQKKKKKNKYRSTTREEWKERLEITAPYIAHTHRSLLPCPCLVDQFSSVFVLSFVLSFPFSSSSFIPFSWTRTLIGCIRIRCFTSQNPSEKHHPLALPSLLSASSLLSPSYSHVSLDDYRDSGRKTVGTVEAEHYIYIYIYLVQSSNEMKYRTRRKKRKERKEQRREMLETKRRKGKFLVVISGSMCR